MHLDDIARRWLVANAISLIVSAGLTVISILMSKILVIEGDGATVAAKACYVAIETVIRALDYAVYALLTGNVLSSVIPALPRHAWLAVNTAMGLVFGLCLGLYALLPSGNEPVDRSGMAEMIFWFLFYVVTGAFFVAVGGILQALVLRRAAYGARAWVAFSALAGGVMGLIVASAYAISERWLSDDLVWTGLMAIAGAVGAVVMVPAVRRLRSRSA